jgi:hypothetical protein
MSYAAPQSQTKERDCPFAVTPTLPGLLPSFAPASGPSYFALPGETENRQPSTLLDPQAAATMFSYVGESSSLPRTRAASPAGVSPAALRTAMAAGGEPLPSEVGGQLSQWFGDDFSQVRVHFDTRAAQLSGAIGADAFAFGTNLFFGEGLYAPETPRGKQLLAHELAHVVQFRGQEPALTGEGDRQPSITVGASATAAEHEARATAEAFERGGPRPVLGATHGNPIIQRSDAAVHRDIELTASEAGKAPNLARPDVAEPVAGSRMAGALELYSGNWTNDLTQLKVPGFYQILSEGLQTAHAPGQPVTGLQVESVMNGMLKAMAILEFGERIADNTTAGDKLVPYQPQDHLDNPIGLRSEDLLVKDGELRPASTVQYPRLRAFNHGRPLPVRDAARDKGLAGAALPGRQVDNPELYKVSSAGLAKHIYNSVEATKQFWLQAAVAGPTPEGRRLLGRGMHIVEDYFAHSNFIEVALNEFIDFALAHRKNTDAGLSPECKRFAERVAAQQPDGRTAGQPHTWVDPLFHPEPSGPAAGRTKPRSAITTGTFGPDDTRVSIAHMLVPMLPKVNAALELAIEPLLSVIEVKGDVQMSFATAMKALAARSRPGAAMAALLTGLEGGGVVVPVPSLAFAWPPVNFNTREPLAQAFGTYSGIYMTLQNSPEPLRGIAIGLIQNRLRTTLHSGIHSLLVAITAFVTGEDRESLAGLDESTLLGRSESAEAQLVPKTAIEKRLAAGGDLAGLAPEDRALTVGSGRGVPSHSQINKDHPDSLFHGLHKQLALEADRHILLSMQTVWQGRGSLFGDGAIFSPRTLAGHHDVTAAATSQSNRARRLYQHDLPGASFAQSDGQNQSALRAQPGLSELLNLADLFISHPGDNTWWRGIVSAYVSTHADEVARHISQRGRGPATVPTSPKH